MMVNKESGSQKKNIPDLDSNVAIHHVDPLGDLQQKHLGDSKMKFQVVLKKGPIKTIDLG